MRKFLTASGLAVSLLLPVSTVLAAPSQTAKAAPGTIVIVFKDGRRQVYNLADIQRLEFPTADSTGATAAGGQSSGGPSRGHYLGKWEVGDGSGSNFNIVLLEDGSAKRSLGNERGTWVYSNGEALITWNDGRHDAIRKVGSRYQKFAYSEDKSFTDDPDNVTNARNTMPQPHLGHPPANGPAKPHARILDRVSWR